jgi:hypothetical protein
MKFHPYLHNLEIKEEEHDGIYLLSKQKNYDDYFLGKYKDNTIYTTSF